MKKILLITLFLTFVETYDDEETENLPAPISAMLSDIYSKLPNDATQEEKNKFFPLGKRISLRCPIGQFRDESLGRYDLGPHCYILPKFPSYNDNELVLIQDEKTRLVPCSADRNECASISPHSACHFRTGFRFRSFGDSRFDSSIYIGVCVKSTGIIDVLSEMYNSLPADKKVQERSKYVADPVIRCIGGILCRAGYWCLDVDTSIISFDKRCFRISNSLPTTYDEGSIFIPKYHFATCNAHHDCQCSEENNCKCFTSPELKLVVRNQIDGQKTFRNGFCILANPVAFVYFLMYQDALRVGFFKEYLPVGYRYTSSERVQPKFCWRNKDCEDLEFCGAVYNYETGGLKENLRHCFGVPASLGPFWFIVVQQDVSEMILCGATLRCRQDKSWQCATGYNLKFQRFTPPNYSILEGVCAKEFPFPNVFVAQYRAVEARSDKKYNDLLVFMPVGFKSLHEKNDPKQCSKNEDCQMDEGQFCGSVHDYFDNTAKPQLAHCYAVPQSVDSNDTVVIADLKPDEKEMQLCNTDTDCPKSRCHLIAGQTFIRQVEIFSGFCIKTPPVSFLLSNVYLNATSVDEKMGFLAKKYENVSDECLSNDDCDVDQFCGSILDFSTMLAKSTFYCFEVPQFAPSSKNGSRIVHIPQNTTDLLLCDSSSDCQDDEILRCDLETGWIFVGLKEGKRVEYNGICIKGLLIGFVYSETFWNLGNDDDFEQKQKYLAVDPLKTCSSNKDCNSGQFCEHPFDFTNRLANPNHLYCFSTPEVDEKFRDLTKTGTIQNEIGLRSCNIPSDCNFEEYFCNTQTGQKYVAMKKGTNEIAIFNGVCMKADICKVNEYNERFKWSFGTSPTDLKINCDSDLDCAGVRDTSNEQFQGYCKKSLAYHNTNLCCHRQVQKCEHGQIVGPAIRCGKTVAKNETLKMFAECNGGLEKVQKQETKSEKWCDSAASQCCQIPSAPTTFTQFCPDQQTPLFNEPKCLENGKCSQKIGSICQNGHCCPDARFNSTTRTLPKRQYSYTTNYPCLAGHRPAQFPHNAYCEKETEKVVIFGHLSALNESLTRFLTDDGNAKKCQNDDDCSTDNSTICIYDPQPFCYYNPKRHVPLKNSHLVLIISLSIVGLFIVIMTSAAITFWFLKKKKSMKIAKSLEEPKASTESMSRTSTTAVTTPSNPVSKSV